jgi:hypothetical protein
VLLSYEVFLHGVKLVFRRVRSEADTLFNALL